MILLVTGSRHWTQEGHDLVHDVLGKIHAKTPIKLIIHGAASGIDSIAETWAKINEVPYLGVPAKWLSTTPKHAAGTLRNAYMADMIGLAGLKPVVLSFPGGPGTADMTRRARKAGLKVVAIKAKR